MRMNKERKLKLFKCAQAQRHLTNMKEDQQGKKEGQQAWYDTIMPNVKTLIHL